MSEVKSTEKNEEEIAVVLNTLIYSELLNTTIIREMDKANVYEIARNLKLENSGVE